jgi:hypothetical protein
MLGPGSCSIETEYFCSGGATILIFSVGGVMHMIFFALRFGT